MAQIKITPRGGQEGQWSTTRAQAQEQPEAQAQVLLEAQITPGTPYPGEMDKRRKGGEETGRGGASPGSSPTRQLAQMVVEAGPSKPAGEELARRKLHLIVGGKVPCKDFLKAAPLP